MCARGIVGGAFGLHCGARGQCTVKPMTFFFFQQHVLVHSTCRAILLPALMLICTAVILTSRRHTLSLVSRWTKASTRLHHRLSGTRLAAPPRKCEKD